jgi:CheY-like chemotaxis protein
MTRLLLETPLSSEQRRYAELVRTSGETLMALINHILDLSKIEAGKMLLESVDFDLRAMLESATEMLALQAGAKGLELTCLMMPETPSHLRGDPGRLRQVIINLAANAVKFTERGEVSIRVEPVRDDGRHAALRFTIADTGIGINKERARALFSPFVQADESTTRKFGGTGLGLAISKQLVGMMGGEIGFESEEGKGSTFWFTAVLEKQLEARGVESAGLCKVKALIVDGSRSNRLMVSTLLRSWGCRPSEAADAETAMALLRDAARAGDPFHVALLDKGQPGVGGEELAGRIVADSSLCGTVLLLMVPLGERDFGSQTHSFAAQIRKPVLETRLREVLKAALCNQKPAGDGASVACFQTKPRPAQARSQARILLAEDNLINQEVALALLRQLGYMTAAVSNGAQAVKALKSARYDVVLMDCEMPELDGYEATRLIRDPATGALDPKIPIIAVTAGAMAGDRERCLQAGMDDYLSKPVEAQEMAQVIAKWIGRKDGVEEAFDGAAFLKRLSGDQALAETIAKRFLGDIPKQLCNLRKHIEEGDATKAGRQAHTLKGAAATVSANALRAIAFEAEQAAKAGKLEEVAELLPRVEEQVERFRAALMEWGHSSING